MTGAGSDAGADGLTVGPGTQRDRAPPDVTWSGARLRELVIAFGARRRDGR